MTNVSLSLTLAILTVTVQTHKGLTYVRVVMDIAELVCFVKMTMNASVAPVSAQQTHNAKTRTGRLNVSVSTALLGMMQLVRAPTLMNVNQEAMHVTAMQAVLIPSDHFSVSVRSVLTEMAQIVRMSMSVHPECMTVTSMQFVLTQLEHFNVSVKMASKAMAQIVRMSMSVRQECIIVIAMQIVQIQLEHFNAFVKMASSGMAEVVRMSMSVRQECINVTSMQTV